MTDRQNFCVYEHWRPDKHRCFYVGKGRLKRARSVAGRNERYTRIIKKLRALGADIEIKIIAIDLSEQQAYQLESELIESWKIAGVDLANHTAGGGGAPCPSPEVIEKIKAARRRQVVTEEHRRAHLAAMRDPVVRARLSAAAKAARARNNYWIGRQHSEKTRAKISAVQKGKKLTPEHRANISAGLRRFNAAQT